MAVFENISASKGAKPSMEIKVLSVGSLVYVTCYGSCWGLRGIIHAVDVIALADGQEALRFYLVALEGGQMKDPLWFVHDDVAEIEGDNGMIPSNQTFAALAA
jgi:hypothetical protein